MNWFGRARRALLPFVATLLGVGGAAAVAGATVIADVTWGAVIAVVGVELVAVTVARLREGRIAVDAWAHQLAGGHGPLRLLLDPADRSETRRLLHALDAILRLHFAQEEELLTSLTTFTGARP